MPISAIADPARSHGSSPGRPRRLVVVVTLAATALLGAACSGGGGSSRDDVIDTLTDPDLENPLTLEEAGCAFDRLTEEFDGDLGSIASGSSLDDEDAAVVAQVTEIVEFCRSGAGPQPADG